MNKKYFRLMKKQTRMMKNYKRLKKMILKEKNTKNEQFRKVFYKAKKLNKIL